jgi:UDP-galactopyranose mutase
MLTKDQKLILALRVNENKDIVFAKYGPNVTKKNKEQIWESIRQVSVHNNIRTPFTFGDFGNPPI